ncbi:exonuclease SbcCD subunit D [Candidatus Bipolaricaulota bacterium]|nr:exonuclease SbcCD subunit D [Candidatus Bipolaricaulota bacterium]
MEVVHFSDTHLGYREFHRTDPETGINQREQDVYDSFNGIVDRILEIDPNLALHAGDLFDNVRPTNRAVNLAIEQFSRLSEANIPTVVIAGNHDTPKISTTGTITRALDRLTNIDAVTADPDGDSTGYRKIPVGPTLVHAVSDTPTEEELAERVKRLEPDKDYRWNILVLHAGIGTLEDQVYSGEFNEHHVNKGLLEQSGFDYVALGHYHKRMEIDMPSKTKVVYCGAPERYSFNESDYEPGFLRVHFNDEGVSYDEELIETRNFISLDTVDGEGRSVREIQEEIESRLPDGSEVEESLVSLKITGINAASYSLLEEKCLAGLRDRAFETNFQVIGPEELQGENSSLTFSDLRTEFSNFMNDRAEISDELDSEQLIETGQKYLGIALGEEDES